MKLFEKFLENHVLANLTFVLVLAMGALTYLQLPREQDPTVNFNWIQITTILPGASAEDVEKRVTDPLEDVLRKVSDIRFVSSSSRESFSSILVRFQEIDQRTFDKRVNDLRREIQNKQDELPDEAEDPEILEITTASGFPAATVVVTGPAADENLRRMGELTRKELERIKGVDRVDATGLHDPELQVLFDPHKLHQLGINPSDLADTAASYFKDVPAGAQKVAGEEWLVRLTGSNADPSWLARLPVMTAEGEVPLGTVAEVRRGREKADRLVSFQGKPAIMLAVIKKEETNTLKLVETLDTYVQNRNLTAQQTGVLLTLADDQTEITRNALNIMQTNAFLGLILVMLVSWLFLGFRIAFLVSIGIPFALAGTFWALGAMGHTLNVMVLLGIVIVLGMLVDDTVVVIENIHYRLNRGVEKLQAVTGALREIVPPVTTSIMTTMAAFLPLLLMPGIVGKFMGVVPVVVTVALLLSLVEAYWMLPAHVLAMQMTSADNAASRLRRRVNHKIRIVYTRLLIKVMRFPILALATLLLVFSLAIGALMTGRIKMDFFASDTLRIFYVSVEMPTGTSVEATLKKMQEVEAVVRKHTSEEEVRSIVSYSGQLFNDTEVLFGDLYGQVLISLNPAQSGFRHVNDVVEDMREDIMKVPGTANTSFFKITGGPPTTKPISVKVRGDDFNEILAGVEDLRKVLMGMDGVSDILDDASRGRPELSLRFDPGPLQESGLSPAMVARNLRLLVDGEIVATMQDKGEELEVRVRAAPHIEEDVDNILQASLALPGGGEVPMNELLLTEKRKGMGSIRHYNFRRSITVDAELDDEVMNTVAANRLIGEKWQTDYAAQNPNVVLDFTGELDDIQESLDSIQKLFLLGLGLIYLIIGTQFRSYFQPFMILITVPMAFTGVIAGLLITQNPLSLYTLYGVVALAGIAVNAAIVLIAAANVRMERGMTSTHAAIYAARRRVVPICISSLTTISGLMSLALGLGGKSLIWGPVATAIVWGLAFSSVLTLFAIPVLYRVFVRTKPRPAS